MLRRERERAGPVRPSLAGPDACSPVGTPLPPPAILCFNFTISEQTIPLEEQLSWQFVSFFWSSLKTNRPHKYEIYFLHTYRDTLAVDTVHHPERRSEVRVPRLLQLVRLASKSTFWNITNISIITLSVCLSFPRPLWRVRKILGERFREIWRRLRWSWQMS